MLRIAIIQAKKSSVRAKHGAIIANGKRILGFGHNSYKSHPKWSSHKLHSRYGTDLFTVHAEAAAIRDTLRRGCNPKGATLYVARTGSSNQMSRPCEDCQKLIDRYGIRRVIYTGQNGGQINGT